MSDKATQKQREFNRLFIQVRQLTQSKSDANGVILLACCCGFPLREVVRFRIEFLVSKEFTSRVSSLATAASISPPKLRKWVYGFIEASKTRTGFAFRGRKGSYPITPRTAERRMKLYFDRIDGSFQSASRIGRDVQRQYQDKPRYRELDGTPDKAALINTSIERVKGLLISRHGRDYDDVVQEIRIRLLSNGQKYDLLNDAARAVLSVSQFIRVERAQLSSSTERTMGNADKWIRDVRTTRIADSLIESDMKYLVLEQLEHLAPVEQAAVRHYFELSNGTDKDAEDMELLEVWKDRASARIKRLAERGVRKIRNRIMSSYSN